MNRNFKIIGCLVVAWDTLYLSWLAFHVTGLGFILLFAEILIASLTYLLILNHWGQNHTFAHPGRAHGSVDIYIPTVNEPLEMVETTVQAAALINYDQKAIYLLDDGPRPEIKDLADKYGIGYFARGNRKDNKAGNLNYALVRTRGDYVLVIDADHIANPHIISDLLGHFNEDPKIAIVATRQAYLVPEGDFNHDVLFYQHMMAGKHEDNASISCGNAAFYRREALRNINGFQTWNLVEDLYTSYVLHTKGFRTVYVNEPYTYGTAPLDLAAIYQQRGTWALDTLRMVFWHSPLFTRGLSMWQRLHYIEIGYSYIVAAIAMPIVFFLPAFAVLQNDPVVTDPVLYLLLRIPSLLAILYFYYRLSDRSVHQMQFWASLWPVYLKSMLLALAGIKVPYRVTRKISVGKRHILQVFPHIALILFSVSVIIWRVFYVDDGLNAFTAINLMWMLLMAFWFYPIIIRGFSKIDQEKEWELAKSHLSNKHPHLFTKHSPRIKDLKIPAPPMNLPIGMPSPDTSNS